MIFLLMNVARNLNINHCKVWYVFLTQVLELQFVSVQCMELHLISDLGTRHQLSNGSKHRPLFVLADQGNYCRIYL